jgi:hypothetical protein
MSAPLPEPWSRRGLLGAGMAAVLSPAAFAAAPRGGTLSFVVSRNGVVVGRHHMTFSGPAEALQVLTQVEMTVKLGPVPVFRYRHTADERWSDGRFASLETYTDANGRKRRVAARRTEAGVLIDAGAGKIAAPADTAPLTHWNQAALGERLFNPQEGKLLKIAARKGAIETLKTADGGPLRATRWTLRGDAEIDNWYDSAGAWAALRGKLPDGSTMEYRRS